MSNVIYIDATKAEQDREEREQMLSAIEELLARVRSGELIGVGFVGIPTDRQRLTVGLVKMTACGLHELVGATTILNDYLRKATADLDEYE